VSAEKSAAAFWRGEQQEQHQVRKNISISIEELSKVPSGKNGTASSTEIAMARPNESIASVASTSQRWTYYGGKETKFVCLIISVLIASLIIMVQNCWYHWRIKDWIRVDGIASRTDRKIWRHLLLYFW
jgi:hypothetical protein